MNERELDLIARAVGRAVDDSEQRTRAELSELSHKSSRPTSTSDQAVDSMVNAVAGLIQRSLAPLAKRIAELEDRRTMAFKGAFDPATTYMAGDCVQRASGLWIALTDTTETPGQTDGAQWRRIGAAG